MSEGRDEIKKAIDATLNSVFISELDGSMRLRLGPIQDLVDKAYEQGRADGVQSAIDLLKKLRPEHTGLGIIIHQLKELCGKEGK